MFSSRALTSAARIAAPRTPIAVRVAATRAYAQAAAPSSSNTKPPVALFGIDGTYASALVRLSRAQLAVSTPPETPDRPCPPAMAPAAHG